MEIIEIVGKVLFSLLFIGSGINHFKNTSSMAGYAMAKGLKFADLNVYLSGVLLVMVESLVRRVKSAQIHCNQSHCVDHVKQLHGDIHALLAIHTHAIVRTITNVVHLAHSKSPSLTSPFFPIPLLGVSS